MKMIILKGYHTSDTRIENIVEIKVDSNEPLCNFIESANELIQLLPIKDAPSPSESDEQESSTSRITELIIDEVLKV